MFKEAVDANSNPRACPRLQPKTHSSELLSQAGVEGLTAGFIPWAGTSCLLTVFPEACKSEDLALCVRN